tara:strand:- start:168 stop:1202 length:1035 start_codon:yes stop_codon:yes gene_type:complete
MKILITGGTGFQGSNLSKSLLEDGYDVTILNLHSSKNETNVERFGLEKANIIWGTINDIHTIRDAAHDSDLIVHAAAKIHVDDSIKHPIDYFKTNVMGTNNVLEVARQFKVPVMNVSTCEVYGHQDGDLDENSPLMPRSPYAASKAGADRMAYSYYATYDMNVTTVRPFNIFGPGQKDGKVGAVIPIWTTSLLNGRDITVYGTGDQSREYVYIDDLILAYKIIIHKMLRGDSLAGEAINVGSGVDVKLKDLAEKLIGKVNKILWKEPKNHDFSYPVHAENKEQSNVIFGDARPGEVRRFISNSNKMKSLNWSLEVDLESGLDKYIQWRKDIEDTDFRRNLMMTM